MDSPAGIKGFIFKPVIRAVNNSTAGTLQGLVTDNEKVIIEAASIVIKQDGTDVATAITGTDGRYVAMGLPSGTYSVAASKENFETVTIDDVKITAGNKTVLSFVLPKK